MGRHKGPHKKKKWFCVSKDAPTERWCASCRKMQTFVYNRFLGHSRCEKCGCPFGNMTPPSRISIYDLHDGMVRREWKDFTGDKETTFFRQVTGGDLKFKNVESFVE